MSMLAGNLSLHCRDEAPRAPMRLQAGPLAMLFEPESAFVRRICLGELEVLRGIYLAVRDRNWGTVPMRVDSLKQDIGSNGFELSFAADCHAGDIHFQWNGLLCGGSDGTLRYVFDGEAVTSFLKNRIGLCVLHPLRECCGAPARYESAEGNNGEVRFPMLIEPQIVGRSTFSNLHRLAHEVRPGCWAELEFEGDQFETEDQRNWTDASFKTYCTPLALPFPVEIKAGTRVRQAVTLRLVDRERPGLVKAQSAGGALAQAAQTQKDEKASGVTLVVPREPARLMPRIGLGIATHGIPLNPQEVSRLSVLQLSHLRVDLWLADPGWPEALSRAATEAQQLGVALELALHLGPQGSESAVERCGAILKSVRVPVARVLAFRQFEPASSLATLELVRRCLGLSEVVLGGGSDAHFCELNREHTLSRFGLAAADFVSWPITPQVHAFDNISVMENLEAQPHTVTTARAFADNRPLVVSPITLRPRFNAVATGEQGLDPAQLPPPVDSRQLSLFAAAWTLGSLSALSGTGVASLTYFETTGWRGLMESTPPSARHRLFPSIPGMIFPVYWVFAALAGFSRMAPVVQDDRSRNTQASLCLFGPEGKRRLLCTNLSGSDLPIMLDLGTKRVSLRTLDLTEENDRVSGNTGLNWSRPEQRDCPSGVLRLVLSPYAIASLDSVRTV